MIVCTSVSHGNTRKVADTIAGVLGCPVVDPAQVDAATIAEQDLVGFGSGIFSLALHPQLREFVSSLPAGQRGSAFVFATSGFPEPPFRPYLKNFAHTVEGKGFDVVGRLSVRAYDTWWPLRIVGGVNKGRPNDADLDAARIFAERLRADLDAAS